MIETLPRWGWDEHLQKAYDERKLDPQVFSPGRILSQREDTFTLATEQGTCWAHPAGVLFHRCRSRERPGVGDWVVLERVDCPITDEETKVTVTHSVVEVLPRKSLFLREAPGGRGEAQVVATNVDKVFIVNPAGDLNLNRMERLAVAIASGGAEPAIVLSKGDLVEADRLELARAAAREVADNMEVLVCCDAPRRVEEIRETLSPVLRPAHTYALVGASGVGKSTLVNALLGEEVQETGEVRAADSKGRHVTNFRELFPLEGGALMMDTPGIREFGLWSQGEGMESIFSEIYELQRECRFSDCSHQTEPGCAVSEAVEEGKLSRRRLENWRGLRQELVENEERQERMESRRERSQYRRKVKRDKRFSRR